MGIPGSAPRSLATDPSGSPRWARHLQDLCRRLRFPEREGSRDGDFEEAWLLLASSLLRYLRYHACGAADVEPEDLEDVARQKTLDLLGRVEAGQWEPWTRHPHEVAGYLSQTAHKGLVDVLRFRGRFQPMSVLEPGGPEHGGDGPEAALVGAEDPFALVEREEFVRALCECADRLDARTRRAWFLRVFCGMPSREIATHPDVSSRPLAPAHVDVLLQRARIRIRERMRRKGFETREMPPGTFVELWEKLWRGEGR